ncbi:hypothetical protein F4821DRAFT_233642 [Hypoxylon rubiginosum]|uniref:Uncharacterized protein n=1 Tax=Hypoxylon rubiginosum TaxID=110542 RepID=A0ACC0D7B0_9PEZI|nr:hypothetical protein F4821DRAFT_233642 [Hypoxylon rubiginosum]
MALVLAHVAPLKPEVHLGQAIKEFEAALSKEQQAAFEAGKIHASSLPPNIQDVMHLTAEVDRQARAKNGGGRRCFGPRLIKILESVQQFVSVGDIIIGGSQNLIASGVRSVIRLALLTATRFSAYLDKLSSLFMIVGQSAPRYQEMVALHPRSKALRALGLEYYIVVVRLCRQVVSICNKSTLEQLKVFFKDSDITTYQSELLRYSHSIKEQLSLEEAREDSKARSFLMKFSSQEWSRRQVENKMKLMRGCSTFDYQAAWKQARRCGNATWFANNECYKDWRQNSFSSTLLIPGTLGAGKTVLLANIVSDLSLNATGQIVTYFFCQSDYTESQVYRTIIGCLARQVVESLEVGNLDQLWANPDSEMDENAVEALFTAEAIRNRQIYLVLDGVDECATPVRARLISFIRSLRICLHLKLCISLRLVADLRIQNELARLNPDNVMEMPTVNPDIKDFIQARLVTCLENEELAIGDPALVIEIQEALEEGAQGMFLWVVLQIQTICAQKTDKDIRIALQELPDDLPETFHRILLKAGGLGLEYQSRLLNLIISAIRPLSIDELREAVSVDPTSTIWDPSRLINDINVVVATCGSLLVVDEEQLTVGFIHSSVKQFLLGHFGENRGFRFGLSAANAQMARVVVTYLDYNAFNTVLATVTPSIPTDQLPQSIIASTIPSPSRSRSIALHLLRLRKAPNFDLGRALTTFNPQSRRGPHQEFHFYQYASANWIKHTAAIATGSESLLPKLTVLFQQRCYDETLRWTTHLHKLPEDYILVRWAIDNSHHGILRSQIRNVKVGIRSIYRIAAQLRWRRYEDNPNFRVEFCFTLLIIAAEFGHYDICQRLLGRCAIEVRWSDILDILLKRDVCPMLIAITLVQAQKQDGACSPALVRMLDDQCYPLNGTIICTSAGLTMDIGDKVQMEDIDYTKKHAWGDYHTVWIIFFGNQERIIPANVVVWDNVNYISCCRYHTGIAVGQDRLCACCVPNRYRPIVEELGDLNATTSITDPDRPLRGDPGPNFFPSKDRLDADPWRNLESL